jgi:hypothetical protein
MAMVVQNEAVKTKPNIEGTQSKAWTNITLVWEDWPKPLAGVLFEVGGEWLMIFSNKIRCYDFEELERIDIDGIRLYFMRE